MERLFSSAGHVLTPKRSQLTDTHTSWYFFHLHVTLPFTYQDVWMHSPYGPSLGQTEPITFNDVRSDLQGLKVPIHDVRFLKAEPPCSLTLPWLVPALFQVIVFFPHESGSQGHASVHLMLG